MPTSIAKVFNLSPFAAVLYCLAHDFMNRLFFVNRFGLQGALLIPTLTNHSLNLLCFFRVIYSTMH